jgi:glycerate 2-kinase
MARGLAMADASIVCDICPVADGGEGTLDALIAAMGGRILHADVTGPRGRPVRARYGVTNDGTGVVELAEASGLALLPPVQRDPMRTTTFGTGELNQAAVAHGCRSVIVCIGGSATVDGACGIAQSLGAKFWNEEGELIAQPMTGGMLRRIARWQPPPKLPEIRVACDVTNPLCGPTGAAAVYGPQKGATPEQVRELDAGLAHLAQIVGGDPDMPGSGAAGGAGFGLVNMCGAKLERGIDLVLDAVGFNDRCRDSQLVLTGEGRLDSQSLHGKATMGVAKAAAKRGVPTIAIVGSTGEGAEDCIDPSKGGALHRYVSLTERFGLNRALRETATLVELVAREMVGASET